MGKRWNEVSAVQYQEAKPRVVPFKLSKGGLAALLGLLLLITEKRPDGTGFLPTLATRSATGFSFMKQLWGDLLS